jgi:hypothetical protein
MSAPDELEDRKKVIVAAFGAGITQEDICRSFRVPETALREKLREWDELEPRKAGNAERDRRILKMVDAGVKDRVIMRELGLSRGCVVGVRHRHGRGKSKDESALANRMNCKKLGSKNRLPVFGSGVCLGPEKRPPAEPVVEKAPPPSDDGRWVTFGERTGCCWVEGDVRAETAVFCNAPKCSVVMVGDPSRKRHPVDYCEAHWLERRAKSSRMTRVAA